MATAHDKTSAAPATTVPGLAGPASYQLDPSTSTVTFSHRTMWGLATVRGRFTQVNGTAQIRADGSAHGRLEVAASSVDTRNRKRDSHLRSADFFHAAAHPTITVDLTQAAATDGGIVTASGTLTVAGRTRPLLLTATVTETSADSITLTADTAIDRADFGMTWNQLGMLTGTAQVHVEARFVRTTAA
jgi:polyisoprenoid-binding protein YceI